MRHFMILLEIVARQFALGGILLLELSLLLLAVAWVPQRRTQMFLTRKGEERTAMCNDTRCWVAALGVILCSTLSRCRTAVVRRLPSRFRFCPDEVKDDASQFASHASLAATSAFCAMAAPCNVALLLSLKCHVAYYSPLFIIVLC